MMMRLLKKSKWLFAVAAIGKVISITCCYFLARAYFTQGGYEISFPSDRDLLVRIDTEISYDDHPSMGKSTQQQLRLEAIARGRPTVTTTAARYRVLFDSFRLYNADNWLILGFERLEDQSYHYSTDQRFSPEQRQANYAAFQVDWESQDSGDDRSLLQLPINIVLHPDGRIQEICFEPAMRRHLLDALQTLRIAPAIRELLNQPSEAPALFANKKAQEWSTEGQWLQPMVLEHRVTEASDKRLVVESKSEVTTINQGNTWIRVLEKKVDHNELDLKWTFDPENESLDALDFQWKLALSNKLLNVPDRIQLQAKGSCRFTYELTRPWEGA